MTDTSHDASSSALGYLYQCYWPLLQLVERSSSEIGVAVALELLDDVQFEDDGTPAELIQTKHHAAGAGDLTDMSDDLWRTLNVWMDASETLGPDELPFFTIVTTGTAPADSAAGLLRRDGERDEQHALQRLIIAASTSVKKNTAKSRKRFLELSPSQQQALLEAITVADHEFTIDDLDAQLTRALFWALPYQGAASSFLAHVKGWWLTVAIQLLKRDLLTFTAVDLANAIRDIRDQYRPDNLPTDPDLPDPDDAIVAGLNDRIFVKQLLLIAYSHRQLAIAIRDFYRAFTQRSRWLRNDLVGVAELDRYEKKLVEEWEFVFANRAAELTSESTEADKQQAGRAVLEQVAEDARARVRERYDEPFMTRGTLHSLADSRRVGWHPEFAARLEQLLAPVVEGS